MNSPRLLVAVLALASLPNPSQGAFHMMQIEQIIGGINGDPHAQAIQLRLRGSGQSQVQLASLWAADATGANRVLLLNIANPVSNSAAGERILLATSAFTLDMINGGATTFIPDFTLANAIPASYLNAGRLTFEQDGGTTNSPGFIYWSLAWGGSGYSGSNTNGDSTNGATGGTPFASALPTSSLRGILFQGSATAASTSNSTDYAFSANPATVTKNNGASFTVVALPEPGVMALLATLGFGAFAFARRRG